MTDPAFYSVDPLVMAGRFDSILNPTGMIDRRTSEDAASIDWVLAMIDSGEIVPYWANHAPTDQREEETQDDRYRVYAN